METMHIAILATLGALALFAAFIVAVILRVVVPTNMVHIVQSSKKTTSYGRGKDAGNTYYAWPAWMPKLGVTVTKFPESIFQVALKGYEAYDQARLPFVVDVTAFFRVDDAAVAAQRVASFDELSRDLNAVLQGAVRRVLATNSLEDIMQQRSELGDQFTAEVKEQISEWGVLPVKTIEFMDLRDANGSEVIQNIMEKEQSRIAMESRVKVADNKRQAELAEIDAKREVDVRREDAAQQVGLRTAEKEREVGIAQEKANQAVMQESKVTTENKMEVTRVESLRRAEIDKDVKVVESRALQEAVVIKSEGDLKAAKNEAEGTKVKGIAEAEAQQAMLMAPINTQIELGQAIGANPQFQQYLAMIEQFAVQKAVGTEMAQAMQKADLKVIANAGDVVGGVAKLTDVFSTKGGTGISAMLESLGQSADGKRLIDSFVNRLGGAALAGAATGKGPISDVAA